MSWNEWDKWLLSDDVTKKLCEKAGNIEDVEVPDKYMKIWRDISFMVQVNKARNHNLTEEEMRTCLKQLSKRPYYLSSIAEKFNAKNIVEVGTAEGLQFFSFAEHVSNNNGHVWSCDIVDKRNKAYMDKYKDVTTFCLGDSGVLASKLTEKIDLFYIDASHETGEVLKDVINLVKWQSENPVWIFDDFDKRFGCFSDIQKLCKTSGRFKIYRVGNAASGNPNHQAIIFGRIIN